MKHSLNNNEIQFLGSVATKYREVIMVKGNIKKEKVGENPEAHTTRRGNKEQWNKETQSTSY